MLIQYACHGVVRSLKPIMRMLASQMHIWECVPVGQAHHICIPTTPLPHNCEMLMNEDVYLTSVDRTCCQEGLSWVLSKINVAWSRRFCHMSYVASASYMCNIYLWICVLVRNMLRFLNNYVDLYICVRACLCLSFHGFQACRGRSARCGLYNVYTRSRFTYLIDITRVLFPGPRTGSPK